MHIDEAGSQHLATAVNAMRRLPGVGIVLSDGGDAAMGHRHVKTPVIGFVAAAVHNANIADQSVVLGHVNPREVGGLRRRGVHRARI